MFQKVLILLLFLSYDAFGQEIYKYKNENGKWVFTDKRPVHLEDDTFESIEYERAKRKPSPRVFHRYSKGKYTIVADNPLYAPVEFKVKSKEFSEGFKGFVVPSASQKVLFESQSRIDGFRYGWCLGDPSAVEDEYIYKVPISSMASHKITQSFNGRFSHSEPPNQYAVDIALPVGTDISAARGGTVIWVKDDYHMGGRNDFFLDKANFVKVLHDDGTYATYAHILSGTAKVSAGGVVETGDLLARSGSSGYSTGPHLHFVIRKNSNFKSISTPFKFGSNEGDVFIPKAGMKVEGLGKGF